MFTRAQGFAKGPTIFPELDVILNPSEVDRKHVWRPDSPGWAAESTLCCFYEGPTEGPLGGKSSAG